MIGRNSSIPHNSKSETRNKITSALNVLLIEINRLRINTDSYAGSESKKVIGFVDMHYLNNASSNLRINLENSIDRATKSIRSSEFTVQHGTKFGLSYDKNKNSSLVKFALQLYLIDGLLSMYMGSAIYHFTEEDKYSFDNNKSIALSLDIIPYGGTKRIGKVSCTVLIDSPFEDNNIKSDMKRTINTAPNLNNQFSLPNFRFKRLNRCINWDRVSGANIDKIIKNNDIQSLLACIDDVATGDIGEDDVDPKLLKALQLSQYSAQYLLSCKKVIQTKESLIQSAIQSFDKEESLLDLKIAKLKARNKGLQREHEDLDSLALEYSSILKSINPKLVDNLYKTYKNKCNDDYYEDDHDEHHKVNVIRNKKQVSNLKTKTIKKKQVVKKRIQEDDSNDKSDNSESDEGNVEDISSDDNSHSNIPPEDINLKNDSPRVAIDVPSVIKEDNKKSFASSWKVAVDIGPKSIVNNIELKDFEESIDVKSDLVEVIESQREQLVLKEVVPEKDTAIVDTFEPIDIEEAKPIPKDNKPNVAVKKIEGKYQLSNLDSLMREGKKTKDSSDSDESDVGNRDLSRSRSEFASFNTIRPKTTIKAIPVVKRANSNDSISGLEVDTDLKSSFKNTDESPQIISNNKEFSNLDYQSRELENNREERSSSKPMDIVINNIRDFKEDDGASVYVPSSWNNNNAQPQVSQSLTNTVMSIDSLAISESFEDTKVDIIEQKPHRTASKALTINIDSPLFSPTANLNKTFPPHKSFTPSNNDISNPTENSISQIEMSQDMHYPSSMLKKIVNNSVLSDIDDSSRPNGLMINTDITVDNSDANDSNANINMSNYEELENNRNLSTSRIGFSGEEEQAKLKGSSKWKIRSHTYADPFYESDDIISDDPHQVVDASRNDSIENIDQSQSLVLDMSDFNGPSEKKSFDNSGDYLDDKNIAITSLSTSLDPANGIHTSVLNFLNKRGNEANDFESKGSTFESTKSKEGFGTDDDMVLLGTAKMAGTFTSQLSNTDVYEKDSLNGNNYYSDQLESPGQLSYSTVLAPSPPTKNRDEDIIEETPQWVLGRAPMEMIEMAEAFDVYVNAIRLEPEILESVSEIYISVEFLDVISPPSERIVLNNFTTMQSVGFTAHMCFGKTNLSCLKREIDDYGDDLSFKIKISSSKGSTTENVGHSSINLWVMVEDSCNILRQEVDIISGDESFRLIGSAIVDVRGHRVLKKAIN